MGFISEAKKKVRRGLWWVVFEEFLIMVEKIMYGGQDESRNSNGRISLLIKNLNETQLFDQFTVKMI